MNIISAQQFDLTNNILTTTGNNIYINGLDYISNISGLVTGKYLTGIVAGTNITVVNNNNGSFTVNSSAGGASVPFTITGSGTFNYIPKFTNSSGIVNSNIIDSGNSITFGITNPNQPYSGILTINQSGNIMISSGFQLMINAGATNGGFSSMFVSGDLKNSSTVALYIIPPPGNQRIYLGTPNQNASRLTLDNIQGIEGMPTFLTTDGMTWGSSSTPSIFRSSNDTVFNSFQNGSYIWNGYRFGVSNIENMRLTSGGFLGINTSTPYYNLDVSGYIQCSGVYLLGNPVLTSASNVVYITGNQNISGIKLFSGNFLLYDQYPSGIGYTGVSGLVRTVGSGGLFYINDTGNTLSIDFNNRILSGNWNSNNLNISGSIVATAANLLSTGTNLVTLVRNLSGQININTGTLTGVYVNRNGDTTTGIFVSSGAEFFKTTGIYNVPRDILYLQNVSSGNAISGSQYSPAINFSGNTITGFNISTSMNWRIYEAVFSGSGLLTGGAYSQLNFDSSSASGPYANKMSLTSSGILLVSGRPVQTLLPSNSFNQNIDWSISNTFYNILSGNTAYNFINQQDGQTITVSVSNTGLPWFSGLWPASIRWPGQVTPQQTSGTFTDIYTFIDITGAIYGSAVQGFSL